MIFNHSRTPPQRPSSADPATTDLHTITDAAGARRSVRLGLDLDVLDENRRLGD